MGDDTHPPQVPIPSLGGFTIVGALALVGLIALVDSLDHLVALDDRVWRAVLFMRGCGTDVAVDRSVDLATTVLTVLLVVVAFGNLRMRGVRSTWPLVSTCVLGLCTSKALKHLLTRERPSSLPDVALGYSFPSAHVMNSVVAMIAVIVLTYGFRRRRLWCLLAGALTATVTMGRVLLGHHWACDAVGGVLAALVLVGLVMPAVVRRPVVAPIGLALLLVMTFTLDSWMGEAGLRLPAPLVGRRRALIDIDVGDGLRSDLSGGWREAAQEPTAGSFVWLEGSATVPIEAPGERARPLVVAFGGRTERIQPSCMTLDLELNGRPLGRFVPFSGWREYRLPLATGLLHAGRNELTISAATHDGPARFAIAYVRVAEGSAD